MQRVLHATPGLFRNDKQVQYGEILTGCQRIITFVHLINNRTKVKNPEMSKRAGHQKIDTERVGMGSCLTLAVADHA